MVSNKSNKKFSNYRAVWHAVQVLQDRGSQSSLYGLGIYITLTIGLLIASLVLHNSIRFTERNLIFVSLQPLFLPVFINVGLVAFYLALVSSVTISRERDRGTFEVLLFGPVNETAFILGAFISQIKVYLGALVVTLIWGNLITWILHLSFSFGLVWMLLTSIGMAGVVIAYGILTAVWGGRTRTSLVYFFLVVLILAGIQVGDQVVSGIVNSMGQSSADSLLLLRNVLGMLSNFTQWISPYSQLSQSMDALADGLLAPYLFHLVILLAQGFLLLVVSILILKKKGARG
jgi:hypothetical protein